jgi:hypothetical protein
MERSANKLQRGIADAQESGESLVVANLNKRRVLILSAVVLLFALGAVGFNRLVASKRRAQSMGCVSRMVSIGLSGRLWANDHGGIFPTKFIMMSNELVTPKTLVCPADEFHKKANNWDSYTDANCSYVIVTPAVHEDATNTVFIRCSIHGHLGYPDNLVFDGVRRRGKFD